MSSTTPTPVPAPFDPFAAPEISHTVALTPEQEEIWLAVKLGGEHANLAYNESIALTLTGALDRVALVRAINALVQRHESLRCTLGGDGRQICVLRQLPIVVDVRDVSAGDADTQQLELSRAERESVATPFDLSWGPLVRFTLVIRSNSDHVLIVAAHHVVCDGWSSAVIVAELGELYAKECGEPAAALAPATQLTEYAALRQSEMRAPDAQAALAFWTSQYRDLPSALDLPIDAPRPAEREYAAARVDALVDSALVAKLRQTAASSGTSMVGLLLSAFQVYLYRLTGQRDICVAVPVAGQLVTSSPTLVGHAVRTLPIRAHVDGAQSFASFLRTSQSALLDAREQAQITYGHLIKHIAVPRDPSRLPLVSVMFNVDPDAGVPNFAGVGVTVCSVPRLADNFEWYVNATMHEGGVTLEWMYNASLFTRESTARRLSGFTALLESIALDAEQPVAALGVMGVAEERWLSHALTGPDRIVGDTTVAQQFLRQCASAPEQVAVTCDGISMTYAMLNAASAAVADALLAAGVQPEEPVAVFLPRSLDLVVGLLGVMRAGAAYVPLDPTYPAARLFFVAQDSGARFCVTNDELAWQAPRLQQVRVDQARAGDIAVDHSSAGAVAYLMYTSGSTGQPKGVVIEHGSVMNVIDAMASIVGFSAASSMLAITTAAFDISVLELFMPLTRGGRVVLGTDSERSDGAALTTLLASSACTHMQATPSTYRMLFDAGWSGDRKLTALVGGEALSPELASTLVPRVAALWNCYGPTETTVWSTVEQITSAQVTIGRPIQNTIVRVLDAAQRVVPTGVTGELYIGGRGVARGYRNRAPLTAEKFINNHTVSGRRMYGTGDLVRVRDDGRMEWLGRSDSQVKLRGHRIELGEIETALAECDGVLNAIATVREAASAGGQLVAYVRLNNSAVTADALLDALRGRLPSYMVPSAVVVMDQFPLTPNGKVDRRALPAPFRSTHLPDQAPRTDIERRLADEIATLVGAAGVGRDDDFFTIGGHSLLAMRLLAKIRQVWVVEMPMRELFRAPSVAAMSAFIEAVLLLREPHATVGSDAADDLLI
jgi:amino acid adenylation domain-containing protein